MMKRRILYFLTVVIVGITVSCGPPKLTRSAAAKLIDSSKDFLDTSLLVEISAGAMQEGISQGFWHTNGELTDKGRQFFDGVLDGGPYGTPTALLLQPLKRKVIEVTGIADAASLLGGQSTGNLKEAQFIWEYTEVPVVPKRFIYKGGSGTALFRLYDDGWRVESVSTKELKTPFELSPEEKLAAAVDATAQNQSNIDARLEKLYSDIFTNLSQIENAYQRRADILPSFMNVAKAMETDEKKIVTAAITSRAELGKNPLIKTPTIDPAAFQRFFQAQDNYSSALSRLLTATNKYPQIASSPNFRELVAQLEGTENRIAAIRLSYNEAADEYNTLRMKSTSRKYHSDMPVIKATLSIPAPKVSF